MFKFKKFISVLCVISVLVTSLFCVGAMTAQAGGAATSESSEGQMYTVVVTKGNNRHFGWKINNFKKDDYTVSFDYYLSADMKTQNSRLLFCSVTETNIDSTNPTGAKEAGGVQKTLVDQTQSLLKGYHSFSYDFTTSYDNTGRGLGFRFQEWSVDSVTMYIWNFKVTRKGDNTNLLTDEYIGVDDSIVTVTKSALNKEITGYENYMTRIQLPDNSAPTSVDIHSGLITLSQGEQYKLKFDYYLSNDLLNSDAWCFMPLGHRANGCYSLNDGWGKTTFDRTKGYHSVDCEFTSNTDYTELCFRFYYYGGAYVIIKNISIVKKDTGEKVYNETGWTSSNTSCTVTHTPYDEAEYIKGAMPEIKGAKIKTNTDVNGEQKLNFGIDFSAVSSYPTITKYGFVVAPKTEQNMTAQNIVDSIYAKQQSYTVSSDNKPNELSLVISRGNISAYGKRVVLVAFVTTDEGKTYYTGVSEKSVMGVMKSIFKNENDALKTEFGDQAANKISEAHTKIANETEGYSPENIADIFKKYTGYDGDSEPTIGVNDTDYNLAKLITAKTFYYAKNS